MAGKTYGRSAKLLVDQLKKNGIPMVFVGLLGMIAQFCDSLIAARCLSLESFSAISLATPFTFFKSFVVADVLVGGIYYLVLRLKGEGKDEDADYVVGTLAVNAFVICLLILLVFSLFGRRIMGFYTTDPKLAEQAFRYCLPSFVGLPLQCAFLCVERGLKTDGRLFFFSIRGILSCTLNVVFDLLAIYLLHMGIEGLSWATVASVLVSFTLSFSHFFSGRCSVFPKFSPSKLKSVFPYVKEAMKTGGSLAVEDVFINLSSAVINKSICMTTDQNSLFLSYYAVFTTISSVFAAIRMTVVSMLSQFETVCHLEEDDEGLRKYVTSGIVTLFCCAGIIILFCFLFSEVLAGLFGISLAGGASEFSFCIRVCSVSLIGSGVIFIFGNLCQVMDQKKKYLILAVSQNLMVCACVFFAASFFGIRGIWLSYSAVPVLFGIIALFLFRQMLPGEDVKKVHSIVSYSTVISDRASVDISEEVQQLLKRTLPSNMAMKIAILVEEILTIIGSVNKGRGRSRIITDVRVVQSEDRYIVMVYDNGYPLNLSKQAEKNEYSLNRYLLEQLVNDIEGYRISEINVNKCTIISL